MGFFVEIDKMLNGLVKDMEKFERLSKTNPLDSYKGFLQMVEGFQSTFDEDQVCFFLNQFKTFSKDYSSNQRRLIRNFIFTCSGEGYFQETVNGKKWTKENSVKKALPKNQDGIKFDSMISF